MRKSLFVLPIAALWFTLTVPAQTWAADFSFTGNFMKDDDVQLFNFTADASSNVVLRTWSYAGGTNAAGQPIPSGGFDPILAVFDSTGARIAENDDGGSNVPPDPVTGEQFDTYLELPGLAAGTYTVSVMQYDNFSIGPNLSDGFARTGQPNFTLEFAPPGSTGFFWDVTPTQRDSHWAFDILGVNQAAVPEPSSLVMMGIAAVAGLVLLVRRRKSAD
jgi:hypothetical protein